MARVAQIIDIVCDAWGDEWDVRERRGTPYGFDILIGWPADRVRGKGGGGVCIILTKELAKHLERVRLKPMTHGLPIGNTAVKRLRRLLGHHRQLDRAEWWADRAKDLADLTISQFADQHGVSMGAVVNARHALFGPQLRTAGWWKAPDVSEVILSQLPRAVIAERLGISVGAVGRLRYELRRLLPEDSTISTNTD